MLAGRHPEGSRDELRFAIWPENLPVLELFLALQRQWRVVAGFAGLQFFGFGSADIEAEMRMRHLKDRASLLDGVRVMERAALPIMNEKRDG